MNWTQSIEVKYIMNVPLKQGDSFLKKEIYSYVFPKKPKVKTIIELEYYVNNIIVISFYTDGIGTDKTRYHIRHSYPAIVVLRIYQACLKIFIEKNIAHTYTLVFNAADDINDYQEFNKRMSSYVKFLEYYYPNFSEDCDYSGYMALNTFYFHHKANPFKKQAQAFFEAYCKKVKDQLNNSDDHSK